VFDKYGRQGGMGMLHEAPSESGPDYAAAYKGRLGMVMFVIYGLIYAGFVGINIVSPVLMEKTVLFGLNLAVVYGFGLIIFALVLAVIYNSLCGKREKSAAAGEGRGE
jgi:uncharacterized membrane protein (DUF485 family)